MAVLAHFLALAVLAKSAASSYNETEAILYTEYARISFCEQPAIEHWTCGEMCDAVEVPARVRYLPKSSKWRVQGFVAQMTGHHCILSFRGSVDLKNWEADLRAWPRPWPESGAPWCQNCRVHAGFASAYQELRPLVLDAIQEMECKSIGVVGHSLGGGLATLAGIDLQAGLGLTVKPLYTFGSPRVGNAAFADAFGLARNRTGNFPPQWRIVHHHDPVPHLPPTIPGLENRNYRHTPQEVWYNKHFSEYKVCDPVHGEDKNCSRTVPPARLINLEHVNYLNRTFAHAEMPKACTGPAVDQEVVV
mmetsp:Transcript_110636/g.195947  ORF Transcript_110636/g.195947 Transcript_110636/m.195947 type:complete len:305 (+) Transcript_110636:53-967(+)